MCFIRLRCASGSHRARPWLELPTIRAWIAEFQAGPIKWPIKAYNMSQPPP
jgi:hypothetical protein